MAQKKKKQQRKQTTDEESKSHDGDAQKVTETPTASTSNTKVVAKGEWNDQLDAHVPLHLRLLVTLFAALEFGMSALALYQRTADFETVKHSVESSSQSTFSMELMEKICAVLPKAYVFAYAKKNQDEDSVLAIRKQKLKEDSDSETFTDRITAFCSRVNAIVAERVAALKSEFPDITEDQIKEALDLFALEGIPLPITTEQPTRKSHRELLGLATKPDKHDAHANGDEEMAAALTAPVPEDLQSLPSWLVEKVRRREELHKRVTSKSELAQEHRLLTTLPALCDQIQSYALFKRKYIFSMDDLVRNLTRAPIKSKIEEQIQLIESMVPFWLSVMCSDGKEYVKLDRTRKYNHVKATLRQCIDVAIKQ